MNRMIGALPLTTYASFPDDGDPETAAVFFHGYGADGRDLFNLSGALRPYLPKTAFFFPDAPKKTAGFGFGGGYEWFALDGYDPSLLYTAKDAEKYCKSLMPLAEEARAVTSEYLAQVVSLTGLSAGRTALCGFSQGGLMALYTALRYPEKLAAAVGLSAVAVMFDGKTFTPQDIVSKPPVTLIHGEADNIVPLPVFEMNLANLTQAGIEVESHTIPYLMHGIDNMALRYLCEALKKGLE